jgi:tripartite-type tricarboxylate transporter receptor subunit TctC
MQTTLVSRRKVIMSGLSTTAIASVGLSKRVSAQSDLIKILVGYPPGGAIDVAARAFASELQKVLGSNVVVESRSGASGTLPVASLLQAPPDGLTLMFSPPDAPIILPITNPALKYKTEDFAPIAQVCEFSFGLAINKTVPAVDLKTFLAWCRANADGATYGTPGVGSTMHYLGAEIARVGKVPLRHIPYKGGAQAIIDVVGGQIASLIATAPILVPQHQTDKLKALAVTGNKRMKQMPGVPTFDELGMPELNEQSWFGLFAHRDTKPAFIARLSSATKKVTESTIFIEALEKLGFDPEWENAKDFSNSVRDRQKRWASRIKVTGVLS